MIMLESIEGGGRGVRNLLRGEAKLGSPPPQLPSCATVAELQERERSVY